MDNCVHDQHSTATGLSLEEAKDYINSFDLKVVQERLVKVDKWPPNQAKEACEQYRKFLFLKKKYGTSSDIPPSYDMDEAWHAHILNTQHYMKFCQHVFGKYLHHDPHVGDGGDAKIAELSSMFEHQTKRLYKLEFGEEIFAARVSFSRIIKTLLKKLI